MAGATGLEPVACGFGEHLITKMTIDQENHRYKMII